MIIISEGRNTIAAVMYNRWGMITAHSEGRYNLGCDRCFLTITEARIGTIADHCSYLMYQWDPILTDQPARVYQLYLSWLFCLDRTAYHVIFWQLSFCVTLDICDGLITTGLSFWLVDSIHGHCSCMWRKWMAEILHEKKIFLVVVSILLKMILICYTFS